MNSLNDDIRSKLQRLNIFEKIMLINVVAFILGVIFSKFSFGKTILQWFELPRDFFDFIIQPWSIITYGFLHYNLWHLAMNMFVLYFISKMVLNLFRVKMALNVYFLGILFGGLSYLLVYNVFPANFVMQVGPLVGASAGIHALLIFISTYMPNQEVRFFTFNIKLWYVGLALVIMDVLGLFSEYNQGGNVAHLGGDLLGYLYAIQLTKGIDIGSGFEKFMDTISSWFSPKSPLKTVHKRNKRKKHSQSFAGMNKDEFDQFNKQKRIDLILDKISKSGYDSLTEEEKSFLFRAGRD